MAAGICVIDPVPSTQTHLTTEITDGDPAWSPDGRKIAFQGCRAGVMCGVLVMNPDGTDVKGLIENGGEPAWSPDGLRLTFVSPRPGTGQGPVDLYVADADGTNAVKLLDNLDPPSGSIGGDPAWSPDGSRIAFVNARDIFLINPDGTGLTNLTRSGAEETHPNWSPDGRKIAFGSDDGGGRNVWVTNADGSGTPTALTQGSNPLSLDPVWSPLGDRIAFIRTVSGGRIEVHVMWSDGTGMAMLTNDDEGQRFPDWQPIPRQSNPAPPFDHPRLASPLRFSLVPVHRPTLSQSQCSARGGSPSTHGAPLSFSSCNPPAYRPGTVARLGPQSEGTASVGAIYGDMNAANGDQANLSLRASVSDVQTQAGADYAPNPSGVDATLVAAFRLTDTYNGPSQSDPATTVNFDFDVPLDCAPSAGPEGSTCAADTSADALTPGAIRENESMVMQVLRLRVDDSGLNGVRGDSDDRIFATHGLYVP